MITFFETQKQPPEVFYKRSCSHLCFESFSNRVADRQACNIFWKRFHHSCFPVKIAKVFKNTYICRNVILRQVTALFSSSFNSCTINYNHFHKIVFWSSIILNCAFLWIAYMLPELIYIYIYIYIYTTIKTTKNEKYL